jgi:hypothetical protein
MALAVISRDLTPGIAHCPARTSDPTSNVIHPVGLMMSVMNAIYDDNHV